MNKPIQVRTGEALVAKNVISTSELEMVLAAQKRMISTGEFLRFGEVVVRMGLGDWSDVENALLATGNTSSGINSVNLPASVVRRLRIMPVEIRDRKLHYAPIRPLIARDEAELLLAAQAAGYQVDAVAVHPKSREEVARWIDRITYVDHKLVQEEATLLCADMHDAPLMQRFIEHVFHDALQGRASDVHFARSDDAVYCWISYRIDGVLRRRIILTTRAMSAVCTRLKTIAGLDISETRRPQDGRSTTQFSNRSIDLRISSVPDHDGETIVVRLLDQYRIHSLEYVFRRHPFVGERMRDLAGIRSKSGGIVLVTGPTGQGKSTTLSALMWAMPRTLLKIMSIEDPVEAIIPFVHQSPINLPVGNTYSSLLRAFMRQDPDVMMVGEIRDNETAQEFLRGAETGHLMLSTEHANDCAGTIGRLMNLLPEDLRRPAIFTISSSLRAILNQRLVPALCVCAVADVDAPTRHTRLFDLLGCKSGMSWRLRKRMKCTHCEDTGYHGRELVVEGAFFPATQRLQHDIAQRLAQGLPEQILHCDGVQLYTRIDAVRSLLAEGLIDAATAESVLDISVVQHE
jgi:type II secretory ATPase GspE/PulE/Tfp pilus assembly ATPase PilB-like protein